MKSASARFIYLSVAVYLIFLSIFFGVVGQQDACFGESDEVRDVR